MKGVGRKGRGDEREGENRKERLEERKKREGMGSDERGVPRAFANRVRLSGGFTRYVEWGVCCNEVWGVLAPPGLLSRAGYGWLVIVITEFTCLLCVGGGAPWGRGAEKRGKGSEEREVKGSGVRGGEGRKDGRNRNS